MDKVYEWNLMVMGFKKPNDDAAYYGLEILGYDGKKFDDLS